MSAAGNLPGSDFTDRLVCGLTTGLPWPSAVRTCVEFCLHQPSVVAASLVSLKSPHVLSVDFGARDGARQTPFGQQDLPASFGMLLNEGGILEVVTGLGLYRGMTLQCVPLPDSGVVVILQSASADLPIEADTISRIQSAVQNLTSRSTDREVLLPDLRLLEAMAEFSAGAGHEINNPLASIIGQAQLLLKSDPSMEQRQALETVGAQAWRIRDMIGNAMLFARPPKPQCVSFSLIPVLQKVLSSLQEAADQASTQLSLISQEDHVVIAADQSQISNLTAQLVRNSLQAIALQNATGQPRRDGLVQVSVRSDIDGVLELSITDNGPGIPSPEVRRNLFSPFYSGRSAGRGLGFGLCLARQIVRMHRGFLFFHPAVAGQGAEFHVAIPTHTGASSRG